MKKIKKDNEKMLLIKNPKKDFELHQPPKYLNIIIEKGVEISVPAHFEQNLKTEGII